ncbi:unnamed protein product [Knipowitschia caucasica]|uniref:Uncharacterized protein n=1 Tax=Knipowitschia caucasica TaxID=637954 RepID=A0AAV2M9W6_KNICA
MENDLNPVQEDEGPNAVAQLARKMQGAGTKSWNRLSTLFSQEDEQELLEETESPPVPDHPLAVKPEEPPRPSRRTAFWDSFATNWAAKKQAEAAAANEAAASGQEGEGVEEGGGQQSQDPPISEETQEEGGATTNRFSKYVSLGGGAGGGASGSEDASFKWNFVTSKLADLKTKSMTKTN